MSDDAILTAIDSYRGTMIDLDEQVSVEPSELASARATLISGLRKVGLQSGDRVAMAVGNGPRFVVALTSIIEAGGSPLLLHPDTPPAEIGRVAQLWQTRGTLTDGQPDALQSVAAKTAALGDDSWNHYAWGDQQDSLSADVQFPSLPGVPLHPTSGTTGEPKIAVRPAAAAVAEAEHYIDTIGIDSKDTILTVAPMSHAYAYGCCVMNSLVAGCNLISMRRFNPRLVENAFAAYPVTILPAVPAMVDLMVLGRGIRWETPPRRLLTAGAPLGIRTAQEARKKLLVAIRPLYGTTETGGISVAMDADEEIGACVGPAMKGVESRLRLLPQEEEGIDDGLGILEVRSSSMMSGYLRPEGVDDSLINDGWFSTEDLAWLGEGDAINLRGRQSDMINVFGMKVVPSEVEDVIGAFPGVLDVKVYAGRHRSGSQLVKAAIAAEETFDIAELRAHCENQLVHYKRPEVMTRLDQLPRSPAGKIIKDQLP